MESDAIPISPTHDDETTSDNEDFRMNTSTEPVALTPGRNNAPNMSSHGDTPPSGTPAQAEPSSSSTSTDHPIADRSSTSPQPLSLPITSDAPRLSQDPRVFSSMGGGVAGAADFGGRLPLQRSPTQESASRRQLPSRSPPNHRSPPYQRSVPGEGLPPRYSSTLEFRSPPTHQAFPQSSLDISAPSGTSEGPAQRSVTEYYENLRTEYDALSQELREMTENRCCRVCMDREACVVFMPCAHLSTCSSCASQLSNCPICRSPVHYTHIAAIG